MRDLFLKIYVGLFSFIFAIVFSAQVLGFMGWFTLLNAMLSLVILSPLAYYAYHRIINWHEEFQSAALNSITLRYSLIFSSVLLFGAVFAFRMITYPYSELGSVISSDFTAYHGVKMLDLVRTASFWNMAIPYGDYPNGYESLTAFFMLFDENVIFLGLSQCLISLLLWMTITLLIVRFSKMPFELALFLATLALFAPMLYPYVVQVGKNDMLLSLTILLAILHAPLGTRRFNAYGLAFATMLSLATKASAIYILFYLWGLVMLFWLLEWRKQKAIAYLHPVDFGFSLAIMFVGGLWVIRNYLALGMVFTPEVASFFSTSIAANLTNPILYQAGLSSFWLLISGIILLLASFFSFFIKELSWSAATLILVMGITFILTPLSGFHTPQSNIVAIEWRYGIHLSFFLLVIASVYSWLFASKYLNWLLTNETSLRILSTVAPLTSVSLILVLNPLSLISSSPEQIETFKDPYGSETSVYDFAQSLDAGVLYIENANWFALMYGNPNILLTQGSRYPLRMEGQFPVPDPDYALFVPLPHQLEISYVDLDKNYNWELIYEDETGQVYRRIP